MGGTAGQRGGVRIGAGVAAVLGVAYLVLPPMGTDLSAQVARAGFFGDHGYTPIDLRWYGGVDQLGYSLVSQPVMALLGVRVTGVIALVAGAAALGALLVRTGAARPVLGAIAGAVGLAGNLVSGRVTFGLGVAIGLVALLTLTYPRLRWTVALPLTVLASATSPVAGLFLGLAGVALALGGRVRRGLAVAAAAAVPLAAAALLFGDGGWMNISRTDTIRAAVTALVVALLVPRRAVRAGGVLAALGVVAAALIHTPVGLNATRLATLFALPLLAAYATIPRRTERAAPIWLLMPVLAAVVVWQPPVVIADVRDIGNRAAEESFYRPLRDRLATLPLSGRVEIPPTRNYFEAAYLGDVPLARGWLRQADIDRNPLFFTGIPGATGTGVELTAESYRSWLSGNSVQYVAVPRTELSWVGRAEAELIMGGAGYLRPLWTHPDWQLYAVTDPQPIVAPPATLTAHDAASLTFTAPAAGDVTVRVRWYRWLTVTGGATVEASGAWTLIRVPAAGSYTLTSGL